MEEVLTEGKVKPIEFLKNIVFLILITFFFYFVLLGCVETVKVEGSSMYPTLEDGNHVLVNKLAANVKKLNRYDVIVFRSIADKNRYCIKRIVGMPNEEIRIDEEGNIYINDEIIFDTYLADTIKDAGLAGNDLQLGADEYFVMGDNCNYSMDSRDQRVGNIKIENIVGKAVLRVWPLKEITIF